MSYAIAHKNIAGEIIDDELVIIDLTRGVYFSSKGSSLILWRAISSGQDARAVVKELAKRSPDAEGFEASALSWLETLLREGVLREDTDCAVGGVDAFITSLSEQPITSPTLEMHEDLEDILLFDPVHDFDELGWPKQPQR